MKVLLAAVKWDVKQLLRYHIATVSLLIALLYVLVLRLLPLPDTRQAAIFLVFTDPSLLGFFFSGIILLFEKGAGTLQALIVTPVQHWQYLWARATSLMLAAMVCSLVIAIGGHGWQLNYWLFLPAVVLTTLFFTFIGIACGVQVRTLSQYIIIVPLFLVPLCLPFLDYFGIYHSMLFYIIPTQASLVLFKASFEPVPSFTVIYALVYLPAAVMAAYWLALRAFRKYIVYNGVVKKDAL